MIDELKPIAPSVFELAKKEGMNVPLRIYANEKILSMIEEGALKQGMNVASLPGIVKASILLPDTHYGYGFPIGGVAAFDLEKGVVSPGGVGFDINCLSGDAKVLSEHGYFKRIQDFEQHLKGKLRCMEFSEKEETNAEILFFMKKRSKDRILRIKTSSGEEITCTPDHPLLTSKGMDPAGNLKKGQKIALYPFKGNKYERPPDRTIIDVEQINSINLPADKKAIIKELEKRDLLPLKADSPKVPYLIKLLAFNSGDGTLVFTKKTHVAWFYGKKNDLELIRKDVKKLGFRPSRVYSRIRNHSIDTKYGNVKFTVTEHSFKVTARSFLILLHAIGAPAGNKANQDFSIPFWLHTIPLWQKRLFLASLFGAELSSPKTISGHEFNFYMPAISVNKTLKFLDSGRKFLQDVSKMLADFGISSTLLDKADEHVTKKGFTYRSRLLINGTPENLLALFERVGFEYNTEKKFLANAAILYLRLKMGVLDERAQANERAIAMYASGNTPKQIYTELESRTVNKRFLQRSLWEQRGSVRISSSFQGFEEFVKQASEGLGKSGMMWDSIASIDESEDNDFVYDFTMNHKDHNFIANSFVVSNCGVRLLSTDLPFEELKPKLREVTARLFESVPAGVGSKSKLRLSDQELEDVLVNGAKWAVENGYGTKEDLEHMEENGCIEGAVPEKCSERAFKRGKPQLGTLGSGNHFLEIQKVEKIFDERIAEAFGIKEGNISVMLHCGSRGFGHQVASDYIRVMESAARKYGIPLVDRQLACAPLNSKEAKDYLGAMFCAVNYAFANRQVITHWVRESFSKVFGEIDMPLVYDVCHNIAKFEEHDINGERKVLCVHRKGATRAFGPGRKEIPAAYRQVGQPVLIPGDMGTASYLLVGTKKAEQETFGSTCHGAGRLMSRSQAMRDFRGTDVKRDLEEKGEVIFAVSPKVLAEEAPGVYKDVDAVVDSVVSAGLSEKVARMIPLGVSKG